jgi:hypothetical protein
MILVLISGLVLAAIAQVGRMGSLDIARIKAGSILIVPFLIMILLKLGLVLTMRARRRVPDESTNSVPPDEALP